MWHQATTEGHKLSSQEAVAILKKLLQRDAKPQRDTKRTTRAKRLNVPFVLLFGSPLPVFTQEPVVKTFLQSDLVSCHRQVLRRHY